MKKIVCTLLASCLIGGGVSFSVNAEPLIRKVREAQVDSWSQVIESMDYADYAGIYYEDGFFHFIPVENSDIKEMISKFKNVQSDFIVDKEFAKYSMQELLDAKAKLDDRMLEYDINLKCIVDKSNSIEVRSENEWSEERKQAIYDVVGIDHVIFTVGGFGEFDFDNIPPE